MDKKYTKTTWENGKTRLNATNLNHIEDGIETLYNEALDENSLIPGNGAKIDKEGDKLRIGIDIVEVTEHLQASGYVEDPDYIHTDNNFTDAEKTKLDGIDMTTKQDVLVSGSNIKTINNESLLGSGNIDITIPTKTSDLTNDSGFITTTQLNTKQDVLESGTNIKTINNQSILGSGNIEIESVSDYNDLSNKPSINGTTLVGNVNLATPEQLNAKQNTLVSGSNIKTINNESLLGSGNIEIEPHFKGWFDNLTSLQTKYSSPVVGDYGYVKGATTTDPVKIYECTTNGTWSDSGREFNSANDQSFATSQALNTVHIKDENGDDDPNAQGVLSAEAGEKLANSIINYYQTTVEITEQTPKGYYDSQTGRYFEQVGRFTTTKIPVIEGEKYLISTRIGNPTIIAYLAQFGGDDGNTWMGNAPNFSGGTQEIVIDREYIVPNGVTFIAVTSSIDYLTIPSVKKVVSEKKFYTKEESDERYLQKDESYGKDEIDEKTTILTETELPILTGRTGYVLFTQTIGSQIAISTADGYGNYSSYQIPANNTVIINVKSGGSYGFAICDENDVVLEYSNNTLAVDGLITFQPREDTTKLYISNIKTNSITLKEINQIKDVVNSNTNRISKAEQDIEVLENDIYSYWRGKTIWWCGTSIPAGSDNTIGAPSTTAGNYPAKVGTILGCNVLNRAVGGSMCRANVRTGNFVGANFANITSCLSRTNAEIEDFISNYDTIKGVLTGNAPDSLSSGYLTRLRESSFESRLLPYLDGTYPMPDLFVLDHGHNDYKYTMPNGSGGTLSDIGLLPTVTNIQDGVLAEDTYMTNNNNAMLESFFGSLSNVPSAKKAEFIASVNRNCFVGSMNFIVTLILHYNPHARIILISNYEYQHGDNKGYAAVIPAQEGIATSWAFPFCEVYKYLGYSDHIIPGSMAWFNATYPSVTAATSDITVFRAFNPDTVHPFSDTTGKSVDEYARVIAGFINGI